MRFGLLFGLPEPATCQLKVRRGQNLLILKALYFFNYGKAIQGVKVNPVLRCPKEAGSHALSNLI